MINKRDILIATIFFLVGSVALSLSYSNVNQRGEKITVESEVQAVRLVTDRAKDEKVNDYWVTNPCVFVESVTRSDYFLVAFHEKHYDNEECPGDPLTRPLIAMFHVSKADGAITWYDIINDKSVPFDDYVKRLKFKK